MGRPTSERMTAQQTARFRDTFNRLMVRASKVRTNLCNVPPLVTTSERWFEAALSPSLRRMPKDAAIELVARLLLAGSCAPILHGEIWALLKLLYAKQLILIAKRRSLTENAAKRIVEAYAEHLEAKPASWPLNAKKRALVISDLQAFMQSFVPQAFMASFGWVPPPDTPSSTWLPQLFIDPNYWTHELLGQLPRRRIASSIAQEKGARNQ